MKIPFRDSPSKNKTPTTEPSSLILSHPLPLSLEPHFIPKLQCYFADFPYTHYAPRLETTNLGNLLRFIERLEWRMINSNEFSGGIGRDLAAAEMCRWIEREQVRRRTILVKHSFGGIVGSEHATPSPLFNLFTQKGNLCPIHPLPYSFSFSSPITNPSEAEPLSSNRILTVFPFDEVRFRIAPIPPNKRYLTIVLGSTNPQRNALFEVTFSTSAQKDLISVITTSIKICTNGWFNLIHTKSSTQPLRRSTLGRSLLPIPRRGISNWFKRYPFSGHMNSDGKLLHTF